MIGVVLSIPLGACMIYLAARNGRIVQPMWVRRSLSSSPVPQDAA